MILNHELPVTASFDAGGKYVEKAAKDEAPTRKDYEKLAEIHLAQISFFQHERLVHLLVTILFSVLTFAVFVLLYIQVGGMADIGMAEGFSWGLLFLFLLLVVLEVPYVMHYYLLENSVQKMYVQYDEMLKRIRQ